MECGIVGLPGAGKTTLFNALTAGHASIVPGASKPNVGVAVVPDPRLALVAKYVETRKVTSATLTLVDIPGIDAGGGAAKAGPLLSHVRQVDAICQVVRCFAAAASRSIDPISDIETLEIELILADLQLAESALDKAVRPARSGDADAKARAAVLEKALEALNDSRPVRTITDWSQPQQTIISSYGLVTAKRVLYVANVGEDDLAGESEPVELVRSHAASSGGEAVTVSGKLEAELAELDEADRLEMLEALGLTEPAIGPVARGVCRLLGLAVFYTTSPKEIRAWTVSGQATAPQAAGVVHSDMQRGFIRAEGYSVDDLVQHECDKAIRAAGRLRTEGKNSCIRDGDVMRFLFSV